MADLIAGMQNYSNSYAKVSSPVKNNQPSSGAGITVKQPGTEITTTTKILIGTGLTALAAAGIYIATRGKKVINNAPVKEAALQTVDKFKSIGKFIKGKAITNSGKNFTGLLTKDLKDGTKLVLNYKDGILQASSKVKGETEIYEKIFAHNEKGILTNVIKNGENIFNKTISPDGTIVAIGTNGGYVKNTAKNVMKVFNNVDGRADYFYKNGKRVLVESSRNVNGNVGVGVYKPDGKTLAYGIDPKTHKFLAEDGTIIDELCIDGLGRIKENGWDRRILKREGYCVNPKHYGKNPEYPMPHADTVSTSVRGEDVLKGSDYFGCYFEHGKGSLVDAGGKKINYDYSEGLKVPLKGKHVSEGFETYLKAPSSKASANVYELGNGKFEICGKNESFRAIFDSKTNTFESLEGFSKEEAKGWLDTALEIQRHFKKDLSVMRQASNAQQKAKAELDALRDLTQY